VWRDGALSSYFIKYKKFAQKYVVSFIDFNTDIQRLSYKSDDIVIKLSRAPTIVKFVNLALSNIGKKE
jgi:hypothetical protein